MAQEVCVTVSAADRAHLAAIIDDRNRPLKHIQRAQIILFSADRLPVLQVAQRAGTSRPVVWRWQRRYAEAGVEGLLRDKTRPPGKKPVLICPRRSGQIALHINRPTEPRSRSAAR